MPKKQAALVLDETQGNAGFKRRVNAALASESGSMAIARVIDRRLAGLDRARSFIDWDKARVFRQDLKGLCDSIIKELAPADVRNRNNSNAARQSIFATRACGA